MKLLRRQPLKKYTSLKIGGPADYFCQPRDVAELKQALAFAREKKLPLAIIGAGSNVLAPDKGWHGLVVKMGAGWHHLTVEGCLVTAGAAVMLPNLVVKMAQRNLGGLEFLAGIPGSLGGAVTMNAGAWGKAIGDSIVQVKALNSLGSEKVFKRGKIKFAYRHSQFPKGQWIVTEVVLRFKKRQRKNIKAQIMAYLAKRRACQPLGVPNCGSVFKNPPGHFAGQLIEAAGCKGLRVGDAQVSTRHANFIINLGEATAADFLQLVSTIQKKVREQFNITLEPEVKIMVESSSVWSTKKKSTR
jgi:UDP-N-acetylmuramate dehydrogenase